eukprot:773855-Ditylum_brightwellii.AAC.1
METPYNKPKKDEESIVENPSADKVEDYKNQPTEDKESTTKPPFEDEAEELMASAPSRNETNSDVFKNDTSCNLPTTPKCALTKLEKLSKNTEMLLMKKIQAQENKARKKFPSSSLQNKLNNDDKIKPVQENTAGKKVPSSSLLYTPNKDDKMKPAFC